ncbi:isoleucine--tRNA ligase [Buchnera aphidicola]|uniref:isoleucine--tRNA ligase n=1 Tax=Buchnera aphidicola TaxID=9 RepID=UPI00223856D3|nr:isoleucine--tRNA ligase [Buchnera aphidicola]MCW5197644.1 isoleucine--tRNA ligase [Buchnera aphidicola (Chaitophorus viminalis)]
MINYKNTLNLPKTKFSMKGNLSQKEIEILKEWKKKNIYSIIIKSKKNNKKFFIHDGPPYANGKIHIGHALNKILKDIIIKFKNLSGYQVPFIPSWDCHGLPIEHNIEKKYKKNFNNLTKEKIRLKCRQHASKQVLKQKKDFIRLGILADWKNPLLTMDYNNQANIIKIVYKIFKKNFLYQGLKPIHWCIKCQSSLAEAEVEHKEKKSDSIYFSLKSYNPKKIFKIFRYKKKNLHIKNIYIIIWTTTPWTLPASQAISINPNLIYSLIQTKNKIFILAEKKIKEVFKLLSIKKYKKINNIEGKKLENIKFIHAFLKIKIPIILSTHVTLEIGTGIVHTAPAHGQEDYIACQKYNIQPKNLINSYGYYKKNIHKKIYKKNIFKSNSIILSLLKKKKSLLKIHTIIHSYPHCWRHKSPVIFRSTKQWFININKKKFRKNTLNLIKNVKWIPKWTENHLQLLIKNRPDWCISRQRSWGVPLPFFIHKKTGLLHNNTKKLLKKIINLVKENGIEAWWKLDKNKFLKKNGNFYYKSSDILDVWFESGCMHTSPRYLYKNKHNIANLYIEGSDQHRGWFMSSLIISSIIQKKPPFKKVITHGFTIDQKGQKMSKSIGNTISPNNIIKKYGADVLRLWVASSNYSKDVSISQEILHQTIDSYRKIRNTARFLLSNLYDFDPKKNSLSKKKMLKIDLWIIEKTFKTQEKIIHLYKKYKFHKVTKKILHFCFIEMSSIYLDIIKDRLYTSDKNSQNRRSCQTAIYLIIQAFTLWITPIIPFTSYEIWKYIPNVNENIFIQKWFKKLFLIPKKDIINSKTWKIIFKIKNEINKLIEKEKEDKNIQSSLNISLILYLDNNLFKKLIIFNNELKFIFLTSKCYIKKYLKAPKNLKKNKNIKGIKIKLKKHTGQKCHRCWNYYKIKKNNETEKSKICNRCVQNINKKEENRIFA